MKFLCLAYGDEQGWNSLSPNEQREALQQDKIIRERDGVTSAVRPTVTSVRNWDSKLEVTHGPYPGHVLPLAGFSLIDAESLEEAISLVSISPCARARGVIDIHPLWDTSDKA